jgi:hypothetical protein
MLEATRPSLIDPAACTVNSSAGWTDGGTEILLAHRDTDDLELNIEVVVGKKDGLVAWLGAHEHVYSTDATDDRPWTSMLVDLAAAVLRGEYEVEECYRRGRRVKVRIIDVFGPGSERVISESGTLISSWLPGLGPIERRRRRVDYGVASGPI